MELTDFVDRLDANLRHADYADVDASANGLQVGERAGTIEHVAFAVDAAEATIEAAIERGADALVVHHGVIWGGLDDVTGHTYRRIAPLVEYDCALYASHLPLDGHPEHGNAAGIADLLDLADTEAFAEMGGEPIGRAGELPEPTLLGDLAAGLEDDLDTGGQHVQVLDHGPSEVESVAVVTGSGVDFLDAAEAIDADVLITGEGKQHAYHQSREAGINVILAGHYATETFGVRSLQALTEEWGIETTFIDHPTGL
jgi:dinuclear metal center YbgI/SA1388 family protein